MKYYKILFTCLIILMLPACLKADDGYRLWLKYDKVSNPALLGNYGRAFQSYYLDAKSSTALAIQNELATGLKGLLGKDVKKVNSVSGNGCLIIGTPQNSSVIKGLNLDSQVRKLGNEGFLIKTVTINKKKCTLITANTDAGLLYGVFHLLKLIQTQQNIENLLVESVPKIQVRLLNHWDNLDGSVERGVCRYINLELGRASQHIEPEI